jgi:hypothetical protein
MGNWYAIVSEGDNDWGTGSFYFNDACRLCREMNDCNETSGTGDRDFYIAEINANYDEYGNPTTDGECVAEWDEDGLMR